MGIKVITSWHTLSIKDEVSASDTLSIIRSPAPTRSRGTLRMTCQVCFNYKNDNNKYMSNLFVIKCTLEIHNTSNYCITVYYCR